MKIKEEKKKLSKLYEEEMKILKFVSISKKGIKYKYVGDNPEYLRMIRRKIDFISGWIEGYMEGKNLK